MKIRILLCDAQELIRQSVATLIMREPDLEVIGECSDGQQLVAAATKQCPDVVILNVALPSLNGMDATEQLRRLCNATRVIVLTNQLNELCVRNTLNAGAVGYLLLSGTTNELLEAIRFARRDKVYLCAEVREMLSSQRKAARSTNGKPVVTVNERRRYDRRRANIGAITCPLSPREKQVLQLIAEGLPAKQIAAQLGVSEPTIKSHRENIKMKLHITSTAEMTLYAVRIRLINVE